MRDFRRLSLEKALELWDVAQDDERKQLRPDSAEESQATGQSCTCGTGKAAKAITGCDERDVRPSTCNPELLNAGKGSEEDELDRQIRASRRGEYY